jgi:F-type H+-transporting ATPase subunit c
MILTHVIQYSSIALLTALTGVGTGIGQGLASANATQALDRQPTAKADINRAMLLSVALIETAALLGMLMSLILFFGPASTIRTPYSFYADLGIIAALALPGFAVGIISAYPVKEGLLSIARQPFLGKKIINALLLTLSLLQTPLVFGFIISWLIQAQASTVSTLGQGLTLLSSGLCIGLGSIGPLLGGGLFTSSACAALGTNKTIYGKIISFTIISQAIIETPIIFAAVIAFWLISLATGPITLASGIKYLSAGLVMAVGTFAPGLSSGRTAQTACRSIAANPTLYSTVSRTSIFGQALIDTCVIYAFIIAVILILLGPI